MEDYPSNSNAKKSIESTSAKKEVKKVVSGEVSRRKKPLSKKFTDTFFQGDIHNAWNYVFLDVLLPAAKDMVSDAGREYLDRILFGDGRSASRRNLGRRGSPEYGYVNYGKISSTRREEPRHSLSHRARATHDFDEIILATRAEAEEVIDRLFDIISQYEVVTVADLYELVGISGTYTDNRWGWTDIQGAGVTKIRGGYLLDLPRPETLER